MINENKRWTVKQRALTIAAISKTYRFLDKNGVLVIIKNLNKFNKDNGFPGSHLYSVALGKEKSYKGYTLYNGEKVTEVEFWGTQNCEATSSEAELCL